MGAFEGTTRGVGRRGEGRENGRGREGKGGEGRLFVGVLMLMERREGEERGRGIERGTEEWSERESGGAEVKWKNRRERKRKERNEWKRKREKRWRNWKRMKDMGKEEGVKRRKKVKESG